MEEKDKIAIIGIAYRNNTDVIDESLGLKFGLHNGIGPFYEHFSYILAIVPFVLVYIFFRKRK